MLRQIFEFISPLVQLLLDAISHKSLLQLFREYVFIARVVVPGFIDLTSLNCQQNPLQNSEYQFVELNLEDLRAGNPTFSIRNRYFKALYRSKRGLRGFALVKDSKVIGDIWCVAPLNQKSPISCTDLDRLGIACTEGDAYAAGIFIDPAFRGNKLAVPIYLSLAFILKMEGWRRMYAYYYEDNISAKWMHLMIKFKELPKLRESRFFFIRKIYKYIQTTPSIRRKYSRNE